MCVSRAELRYLSRQRFKTSLYTLDTQIRVFHFLQIQELSASLDDFYRCHSETKLERQFKLNLSDTPDGNSPSLSGTWSMFFKSNYIPSKLASVSQLEVLTPPTSGSSYESCSMKEFPINIFSVKKSLQLRRDPLSWENFLFLKVQGV